MYGCRYDNSNANLTLSELRKLRLDIRTNSEQIESLKLKVDENEEFLSELKENRKADVKNTTELAALFELNTLGVSPKIEIPNTAKHDAAEKFSKDLLSLLNDASFSDIKIKCGDETFKAHRSILSARSPVFNAMFLNPMRENIEGNVSVDDLDSDTVRDMMAFIYSNQVQSMSVSKACELLNAAEKYQLQSLKHICVEYLMSNLSTENALLILQKADLYDGNLKEHTMNFICQKFSDLKGTEEWKNVQSHNPTLALEVFNKIVGN